MGKQRTLEALRRLDAVRVAVENPQKIPVTLFASEDIPIEPEAISELLGFLALADDLRAIYDAERAGRIAPFFGEEPALAAAALTPDFHKGAGIPVGTVARARGFVVPRAVGNDICCGMRLLVTDARRDELAANADAVARRLRAIFFEGARDIPMSPRQRRAMLAAGLFGLHEAAADNAGLGLWRYYDARAEEADLARAHVGGFEVRGGFSFEDFIRASGAKDGRDAQIGSVGGGNHFVELQAVEELFDGARARAFGLAKGAVCVMAHSGSVGLGHLVGGHFAEEVRRVYPAGLAHPAGGFYVLPARGPRAALGAAYLDAMRSAANFAFANRLFLGLMAVRALSEALGRRVSARLVYDAPHNLIWEEEGGGFLHRKGACPAPGPDAEAGGAFAYTGHPVIIPGSMGASSFVLAGLGSDEALCSACHGAGRVMSRGASSAVDEETYARAVAPLRVVTPIDPQAPAIRARRDILAKYHQRMKEEAPYAYKPVTPVVDTVERAGVARKVARLWPLITVKG